MMIQHWCVKDNSTDGKIGYRRLSPYVTIEVCHESSSVFQPLTTVDNV